MRQGAAGRRAGTLVWGGIVKICLASLLVWWRVSPSSHGRGALGPTLSMVVLTTALLLSTVGIAAVFMGSRLPKGAVWSVAALVGVAAGGVSLMAVTALLATEDSSDHPAGLLLLMGAVGLGALIAHVLRAGRSSVSPAA